jgi:hypothetical protein
MLPMSYSLLTSFTVLYLFCCMTDDMIHVYPFFFALHKPGTGRQFKGFQIAAAV